MARARMLGRVGGLVLAPCGVACTAEGPPTVAALPPLAGRLVWATDADGPLSVWAKAAPNADAERISPEDDASWFPGPVGAQSQMVLTRAEDGPGEHHVEQLWVRTYDGILTPASPVARAVRNPRWAADGSLVFGSSENSFRDIYRSVPGGGVVRLTNHPPGCFEPDVWVENVVMACSGADVDLRWVPLSSESGAVDAAPAVWMVRKGEDMRPTVHPNGGSLAFVAGQDSRLALWMARADARGAGPVWFPEPDEEIVPEQGLAWSPDGRLLALVVRRQGGQPEVRVLAVVDADGQFATTALPRAPWMVRSETPVWAPDGTLFVTHDEGRNADVVRVDVQTGQVETWASTDALEWLPRVWPRAVSQISRP